MDQSDSERETTELSHVREVASGERFEFGSNWTEFIKNLDDDRILSAEKSLKDMLDAEDFSGASFLDIGCGSGLFSLAARRLGARVVSFDFDRLSVNCAVELRAKYNGESDSWKIFQGSVLDQELISSLGTFDYVYSWGVLHHTGNMWEALHNASIPVKEGGRLFIAIYNDMGSQSGRWKIIKRTYCRLPDPLKKPFALVSVAPEELKRFLTFVLRGKPAGYFSYWRNYRGRRGMSKWHDILDWVGGYPYEFAGAGEIFEFYRRLGFRLERLRCDRVGLGCNEFVFTKEPAELPLPERG